MKKFLILMLLWGCSQNIEQEKRITIMIISNANPIQFWTNGELTYNQTIQDTVLITPYVHKSSCSELLKLQWKHDTGVSVLLNVYDMCTEDLLYSLSTTEISTGLYAIEFRPQDYPDMCERAGINLKFETSDAAIPLISNASVSGWSNTPTGDRDWQVSPYILKSTQYKTTITPSVSNAQAVNINVDVNAGAGTKHLFVILSQSVGGSTQTIDFGLVVNGSNIQSITTTAIFDRIALYIEDSASPNDLLINFVTITTQTNVVLVNPSFDVYPPYDFTPWVNVPNAGRDWTWDSGIGAAGAFNLVAPNDYSDYLEQTLPSPIVSGSVVTCKVKYNVQLSGPGNVMRLYTYNGTTTQLVQSQNLNSDGADHEVTFTGTLGINMNAIRLDVNSTTAFITIRILEVELSYGASYTIPSFGGSWSNVGLGYSWMNSGGGYLTIASSASLKVRFFDDGETSNIIKKSIAAAVDQEINYSFEVLPVQNSVGGSPEITLHFLFRKVGVDVYTVDYPVTDLLATTTIIGDFTASDDIDELIITAENTGTATDIEINIFDIDVTVTSPSTELGYTDELEFTDALYDSILLSYKPLKEYSDLVPVVDEEFYNIRLEGMFFHEREITEQINIKTNSKIIATAGSIEKQKLLSLEDGPYYLISKVNLILKMSMVGILIIDGVQWTNKEGFNLVGARPKDYSLQESEVWLTRRNFNSQVTI